jgi:hypothetical protein
MDTGSYALQYNGDELRLVYSLVVTSKVKELTEKGLLEESVFVTYVMLV